MGYFLILKHKTPQSEVFYYRIQSAGGGTWSRITEYTCSTSSPNILSVLESYRFCPLISLFCSLRSKGYYMSLA